VSVIGRQNKFNRKRHRRRRSVMDNDKSNCRRRGANEGWIRRRRVREKMLAHAPLPRVRGNERASRIDITCGMPAPPRRRSHLGFHHAAHYFSESRGRRFSHHLLIRSLPRFALRRAPIVGTRPAIARLQFHLPYVGRTGFSCRSCCGYSAHTTAGEMAESGPQILPTAALRLSSWGH